MENGGMPLAALFASCHFTCAACAAPLHHMWPACMCATFPQMVYPTGSPVHRGMPPTGQLCRRWHHRMEMGREGGVPTASCGSAGAMKNVWPCPALPCPALPNW